MSGISINKNTLLLASAGFCFALVFVFAWVPVSIKAAVSPAPCDGNICTGEIIVGGQTVQYAYTEHVRPDGTFKIRLNGGVYNTGTLISHMIHNLPAFDSVDKYANPANGAVVLPLEDINPTQTAYERYDSDGCAGCIVDQVLTVTYAALATGSYTFDLAVFHNGASGTKNNLSFYVDAATPSNDDESESWVAIPNMDEPCADAIDNDLNFYSDCEDSACVGSVGKVAVLGADCESSETICEHGFDNDADGLIDCLDPDCNSLSGGGGICQYENEFGVAGCADGFDNDGDGLIDCLDNLETVVGRSCWKNAGYGCPATEDCATGVDDDEDQSYSPSHDWDDEPTTGVNCMDYDCQGDVACPSVEHRDASSVNADLQCFNGVDDDLDGLVDCADPDCIGMDEGGVNPNMCFEFEFNLDDRYMLCNNNFNDDADAPYDCADTDCERKFGNCGPCPEREDITYYSCADGIDHDRDGLTDCADIDDCLTVGPGPRLSLGYLDDAARCAADENNDDLCSDNWDNDADSLTDCADDQCDTKRGGVVNLAPVFCESSEASCADIFDNDGNGFMDCMDSNCWNGVDCAAPWVTVPCQTVPRLSSFFSFTSVDPTVTGAAYEASRVNSEDVVRLVGSGTYSSIAIVIGDNTDDNAVYPYADVNPNCTLTGAGSGKLDFVAVPTRVAHIFNIAGEVLNGFDLTFTCPTPATPETWRSYPISISVQHDGTGLTESGDIIISNILYEDDLPLVNSIEAEGEGPPNTITVQRGEARRFRMIAEDPDLGNGSSDICSCTIEIDGDEYSTPDGTCVTDPISGAFLDDATINVRGKSEDGVNNVGNYSAMSLFNVNVTPQMIDPNLSIAPAGIPSGWKDSPYFRQDDRMNMELEVRFQSANSDWFPLATCGVWIYNAAGTLIGGPVGPSTSMLGDNTIASHIDCSDTIDLTGIVPAWGDGEYFVQVSATDNDGDTVFSNRQVFYVCSSKPDFFEVENICSWADFDGDGVSDALFENVYSNDYKPCDNCLNYYNPGQNDRNANGVGEMCEPDDIFGRCQISRDVVCEVGLDPADCNPQIDPDLKCCPIDGGTGQPEECVQDWGLCLHDFDICRLDNNDADCGWCLNASGNKLDPPVGCRLNEDCTVHDGSWSCGSGDGVCQDDPTQTCRRDIDCMDAGAIGPCIDANVCDQLVFPWLETQSSNVFSEMKIMAPVPPPEDRYNATYCVTAKGSILNFNTEMEGADGNPCLETDSDTELERPKEDNAYTTILGMVDINGLIDGKYGDVQTHTEASFVHYWNNVLPMQPLEGQVIYVQAGGQDIEISAREIRNSTFDGRGDGTVIIDGGNLKIVGNLQYEDAPVSRLNNLASLGWIVLPDNNGDYGNVIVDGNVMQVVGSFLIAGEDGLDTVAPPLEISEIPLRVYGLVVGRKMILERAFRNVDRGSEQFIYDGRAVVNPPPGFADVTRSLPTITDTP